MCRSSVVREVCLILQQTNPSSVVVGGFGWEQNLFAVGRVCEGLVVLAIGVCFFIAINSILGRVVSPS